MNVYLFKAQLDFIYVGLHFFRAPFVLSLDNATHVALDLNYLADASHQFLEVRIHEPVVLVVRSRHALLLGVRQLDAEVEETAEFVEELVEDELAEDGQLRLVVQLVEELEVRLVEEEIVAIVEPAKAHEVGDVLAHLLFDRLAHVEVVTHHDEELLQLVLLADLAVEALDLLNHLE